MEHGGRPVTRSDFAANLAGKIQAPFFTAYISPLLAPGYAWNIDEAAVIVSDSLVQRIPVL